MPSVSVVIPVYNESKVIDSCLQAIVSQPQPPDEIVVVDNNSVDDTVERASKYPGVRIVTEPRQGITYARTTGFDEARFDIIARIDADTIVSPGWLATIRAEFDAHPSLSAVGGTAAIAEVSPGNRFWGRWYYAAFRRWHERSIGVSPMMYGFNSALRREAWHSIRDIVTFDDTRISEDVDVTISLLKTGHEVRYMKKLYVKCRLLRTAKMGKLTQYYETDNLTLGKHDYGNPARRKVVS